jgi:hypothetical protein
MPLIARWTWRLLHFHPSITWLYRGKPGIARVGYADATPKHVLDHVNVIDCGNVTEKEETLFIVVVCEFSKWIAFVRLSAFGC